MSIPLSISAIGPSLHAKPEVDDLGNWTKGEQEGAVATGVKGISLLHWYLALPFVFFSR